MFNSAAYGLENPLEKDLGKTLLDGYFQGNSPYMNTPYIPGVTGTMNNVRLRGSLDTDTLETTQKRKNDTKIWTNAFKAILVLGGTLLGFKFLKNPIQKLGNSLKNLFKAKP